MKEEMSADEKDLLEALEHGRLKKTRGASKEMKIARMAAGEFLRKNARINIRISRPDLTLLKRKASEQGLPYQTLISSLLHQFAMGRVRSEQGV